MNCPICSRDVAPIEKRCPNCGANLIEYIQVYNMPDALYNDALTKMRHEHYDEAAELLCRAAGLRPNDREILLAWAQCCSISGRHASAVRVLEKALEYFEDDDFIAELFESESEKAEEN